MHDIYHDLRDKKIPHKPTISVRTLAKVCQVELPRVRKWIKHRDLQATPKSGGHCVDVLEVASWGHHRSDWLRREIGIDGMLRLGFYLSRWAVQAA